MMVACESENTTTKEPVVEFHFGNIEVEATDYSATASVVTPYMTLDGMRYNDVNIYIEYWATGSDVKIKATEYRTSDDGNHLNFALNNLNQDTQYDMYVVLDGGSYGSKHSDTYSFSTEVHIVEYTTTLNYDVAARGLY